jgi:hypothetical protein
MKKEQHRAAECRMKELKKKKIEEKEHIFVLSFHSKIGRNILRLSFQTIRMSNSISSSNHLALQRKNILTFV